MDEERTYEAGDRVAVLRLHGLTGEIQIIPATVMGMIDEYQVMLHFAAGDDLPYPVSDVTAMPSS